MSLHVDDSFSALVHEASRLGTSHLLKMLAMHGINRPSAVRSLTNERISVICLEFEVKTRAQSARADDSQTLRYAHGGTVN